MLYRIFPSHISDFLFLRLTWGRNGCHFLWRNVIIYLLSRFHMDTNDITWFWEEEQNLNLSILRKKIIKQILLQAEKSDLSLPGRAGSPSWDAAVAVWPPCLPGQDFPGLQRCQRVKEFSSPGASRSPSRAEALRVPEAWRGQRGRKAGLAAAFAIVAALNSVESNRSLFVTNVQNFQAWHINNGVFWFFSFQPQCLSSVGFSGPSQLKGHLF